MWQHKKKNTEKRLTKTGQDWTESSILFNTVIVAAISLELTQSSQSNLEGNTELQTFKDVELYGAWHFTLTIQVIQTLSLQASRGRRCFLRTQRSSRTGLSPTKRGFLGASVLYSNTRIHEYFLQSHTRTSSGYNDQYQRRYSERRRLHHRESQCSYERRTYNNCACSSAEVWVVEMGGGCGVTWLGVDTYYYHYCYHCVVSRLKIIIVEFITSKCELYYIHLHTYIHTNKHTYMHTYIPTYLHTFTFISSSQKGFSLLIYKIL